MAISKTVRNPFTKHDSCVKRNTHNTKWVADRDKVMRKQADSKGCLGKLSRSSSNRSDQKSFHSGDLQALPLRLRKLQSGSGETEVSGSSMPCYRSEKNIFNSGLEGEAQEVWTTWKTYEKAHSEQILVHSPDQDVSNFYTMSHKSHRPRHSHRHAVVFPVSLQETAHMQHEKDKRETTNTYTRRDSGVAQSCAKLPMFTEKCTNRAAIMNKPLPPVPRIKPAPKSVRMTGLPPSPHPITQPKNKKTSLTKPQSKTEPNPPRWKESRLTAPQTTLKSKISFRGLLTASKNGSVANNAAKRGSIISSADAASLSIKHTGPLLPRYSSEPISIAKNTLEKIPPLPFYAPAYGLAHQDNAADTKPKRRAVAVRDHTPPTHWRDAFVESAFEASKFIKQSAIEKLDEVIHATRRRKSSDVSFMCQGVEKGGLDVSD